MPAHSLLHANGGTTVAQYSYTVNGRGDRTAAGENLRKADGSYDAWDIAYTYDELARVRQAHTTQGGVNVRRHEYAFDVAGNRLSETVTLGAGSPVTTNWAYNLLNQITNPGYTYDARGNLTNDGANSYTWDRANRLLTTAGVTHAYDGLGNRVTRTAGGVTTRTLLDLQPSLPTALAATTGTNVTRYVHAPGEILAQKDSAANWEWFLADGLGSARGMTNNSGAVLEHRHFDPFGNLFAGAMAQSDHGFTGEPFDATTGLLYLRARHYRPANGTFASRDPYEGTMARPMSRNGYGWVEGRVADGRDPSGLNPCNALFGPAPTSLPFVEKRCPSFIIENSLSSRAVVEIANKWGVSPVMLGMAVETEWQAAKNRITIPYGSILQNHNFNVVGLRVAQFISPLFGYSDQRILGRSPSTGPSLGIANIKALTALQIINTYNMCFSSDFLTSLEQTYAPGQTIPVRGLSSEHFIGRRLQTDPLFSLDIAAAYLADRMRVIRNDVSTLFGERGGTFVQHITDDQYEALAMIHYNQSWEEFTLPALRNYSTLSELHDALIYTIDWPRPDFIEGRFRPDHLRIVCHFQDLVESGLLRGGCEG